MPNATVISPDQLNPIGNANPYDFGNAKKWLAQGDSWFSIGAVPFWSTTNLLFQLTLPEATVIVNCAYPGRELAHMVDTTIDSKFLALLAGKMSYTWDAILLSGGGNDLIDAVQAPPTNTTASRLLLAAAEWDPAVAVPQRYISEPGWATFVEHMNIVVDAFLDARDAGQNLGTPVFMHTYDYPTPRNAPASNFPKLGPWLYPALKDLYAVPVQDWDALANALIDRLCGLLTDIASSRPTRALTVVKTTGTIVRAQDGSTGVSGDWENEIHPTAGGYAKLAARFAAGLPT